MKFINIFAAFGSVLSTSFLSATPAVAQMNNWDYRPTQMYGQEDLHGYDKCQILNDNSSYFGGVTTRSSSGGTTLYSLFSSDQEGLVIKCKNFLEEEVEEKVFFGGPQTEGYSGCKITNDGEENTPIHVGFARMSFYVGPVVIRCNRYSNVNEVQEPYYNEDNCPVFWNGTNPPDWMKDCNNTQEEEQVCGNAEYCTY